MSADKSIVGDLINFRGLVYSPINENDVVFLFGRIIEEPHMYIEEIKPGFPDCVARRFTGKQADQIEHATETLREAYTRIKAAIKAGESTAYFSGGIPYYSFKPYNNDWQGFDAIAYENSGSALGRTNLAADALGGAHAVWITGNTVRYAYKPIGQPWLSPETVVIAASNPRDVSILTDPDNKPHILWDQESPYQQVFHATTNLRYK